jgi:hypothetical protein
VPTRTLAFLIVLVVPVCVLTLLAILAVPVTKDLQAALGTLVVSAGGALGHGFVRDALAIRRVRENQASRTTMRVAPPKHERARVVDREPADSAGDTMRARRDTDPEEPTP